MDHKEVYSTFLRGTCLTMCPHAEVQLRLKSGLGHKLEKRIFDGVRAKFADPQLMIKEFSRSSAGHEIKPSDVRPIPILMKTVKYIFTVVCSFEDVSWQEIYDFVSNRLRAVYQDVIVQGDSGQEVIQILSSAARFYVYSHYRLCENGSFDPYLNFQRLREVMLTVLPLIKERVMMNSNQVDNLADKVISLSIKNNNSLQLEHFEMKKEQEGEYSLNSINSKTHKEECKKDINNIGDFTKKDRLFLKLSLNEEIICLHLLTNIGKPEVILDILKMPKDLRTGAVRNVTEAITSYLCGNHLPLIRLAFLLPPVLAVALTLQLNEIQRRVLGAWSVAYNSASLCYKIEDLKKLLLFSSENSLIDACNHYGILTSEAGVRFIKDKFDWNVSMLPPENADWVEEKLNALPLPHLLLGKKF